MWARMRHHGRHERLRDEPSGICCKQGGFCHNLVCGAFTRTNVTTVILKSRASRGVHRQHPQHTTYAVFIFWGGGGDTKV